MQEAEPAKTHMQEQLDQERRVSWEQANELKALREDMERVNRENIDLKQQVETFTTQWSQLLTFHGEEKQKELGNCVLSVAYEAADISQKYSVALQSFLDPIEEKYIVKTEVLQEAQACRLLLWVIFAGGKLPDAMPRFEKFASAAGKVHSL